jgi:hypothetical protein
MKITGKDLTNLPKLSSRVRMLTYSNGGVAYVCKRECSGIQNNPNKRCGFPPVNRNEPMIKTAFKRTLNKKFNEILELDLDNDRCLSLTLTIRSKEYNTYEKISDRFKHFTNGVRFGKKAGGTYLGNVRFIEVQEKGFFHIHCLLFFDTDNIKLGWKDLHRMWGWGYVKVKTVYYFIGLLDYLTNYKDGAENPSDSKFTRYPKGARTILIMPNLPKAKDKTIDITDEEYAALLRDKNVIGHLKIHRYYDRTTGRIRTHIDKMALIKMPTKKGEYG